MEKTERKFIFQKIYKSSLTDLNSVLLGLNFLTPLSQYKAGRVLICGVAGERGVMEILNKLIKVMSLENPVFAQQDSSFHPQAIVSELLREIIVSGQFFRCCWLLRC